MKIKYYGEKIEINVKEVSFFGKFTGLMFRSKNTKNLLFDFKTRGRTRIHSFFVFFPFLAVWLDEKNLVLESKIIMPFSTTIAPKKEYVKLIEIPLNERNFKLIEFFDGRGKI